MSENTFGRRDLFKRAAVAGAGMAALSPSLGAFAQADAATTADKVPTRVLGKTGEKIPILLIGGSYNIDPVFDNILHRAFKEGCFYIDTAESYANGQSHVGVSTFAQQVGRENLWITSKSGMFRGESPAPPEQYKQVIEKEFPVLKFDQIDMYFFHGLRHLECLEPEYLAMVDGLKKAGKTKYFGFSCHDGNVVGLMNKAAQLGSDAVQGIMFRYNFAQYGDLELNKAMDACVKAGIGLIAMKTQMSVPEDKDEVKRFSSDAGFNLFQAKLKAVWADERITAAVSKMSSVDILRQNMDAAKNATQLSMRDVQKLRQYAIRTASLRCNGCNHVCESRVEGDLRISDTLRYLMYSDSYGEHAEAKALYHALRPSERAFSGVVLDAATAACPQGIDIAQRLSDAAVRFA